MNKKISLSLVEVARINTALDYFAKDLYSSEVRSSYLEIKSKLMSVFGE